MSKQYQANSEPRAPHLARDLKAARRKTPEYGIGVFMRLALAVVFVYLMIFSYLTLGVAGPAVVGALFLISVLVPVLHRSTKRFIRKRQLGRDRVVRIGKADAGNDG